jgi:polar amino acid transport system substrate-binding protein
MRERIAKPDLSNVVRIRFLTTVDFPPLNFLDQTGRLVGFQVDLVREICRELALADRCQIEALPYDELLPALASGRGEAIIAGMRPTFELRRDVVFSRPFMLFPARFVINRISPTHPETLASLKTTDVGVVASSRHQAMLTAFFPDIKQKAYPDLPALLEALQRNDVGAIFADGLKLALWMSDPASAGCCDFLGGAYVSPEFLGEGASIAVKNSDAKLAAAFDHALLTLLRNGRLNQLYLRYFPNGLFEPRG